jgi:ribose-phosphate pyrophosphokinase
MAFREQAGRLQVFALGRSRELGDKVARHLGIGLSPHDEREFEDGEHKVRPLVSVRGDDVYVIHSLYAEAGQSGHDKLCRLLFFIGALKDAAAARVTAIAPYLAYARKDRKTQPRDPVMTRYVAQMFEAVGTDVVVTLEVHDVAVFQNAYRCRTEHLDATALFVGHFTPLFRDDDLAVVAPDAGAMKRADLLRRRLSATLARPIGAAFAEKHRSGGIVSGDLLVGEVQGKTALIVDDMIGTGTTMARTALACQRNGATRVIAVATHGLFTPGADAAVAESALHQVIVTDSIAAGRLASPVAAAKVSALSCAGLLAEAIARMHSGGSIVDLLNNV